MWIAVGPLGRHRAAPAVGREVQHVEAGRGLRELPGRKERRCLSHEGSGKTRQKGSVVTFVSGQSTRWIVKGLTCITPGPLSVTGCPFISSCPVPYYDSRVGPSHFGFNKL